MGQGRMTETVWGAKKEPREGRSDQSAPRSERPSLGGSQRWPGQRGGRSDQPSWRGDDQFSLSFSPSLAVTLPVYIYICTTEGWALPIYCGPKKEGKLGMSGCNPS